MRGTSIQARGNQSPPELRSVNAIEKRFCAVRKYTEYICEPLAIEDFVVQPIADVSPPKWHLGHTTWFFEEFVLVPFYKNYSRFHPHYAFVFNSYYDAVGARVGRPERGNLSRPTVDEVFQYRAYVDEHMKWLFHELPEEAVSIIETGINHEQQHQELLYTDIKYILGHNPLFPPYKKEVREAAAFETDHDFIILPAGNYMIGHAGTDFAYDNESGCHQVYLDTFHIRSSLVTNREYVAFMQDAGYERSEFWHSDGWQWVQENAISAPMYWHLIDGIWCRYALSGLERVKPDEPVTHLSFYEAHAFAEWSGMRLPTEFEWEAAADKLSWGSRWEHTSSAYLPYPGYQKPSGPLGEYNGKFMVNTMVLRGASLLTPENHSRKTYRNFFYPWLRWQFNGIRLCSK